MLLENVRIPLDNIILGEGRGFEIAQGRLGPGRIHHCMRTIGASENALKLMVERLASRVAFRKKLMDFSVWDQRVADARTHVEMLRMLCLKAAYILDTRGNHAARNEIAIIKLAATLGEKVTDLTLEKFSAGQSNPTYKMRAAGRDFVLRRKPFGELLPSAHAVDREFRIIEALSRANFPVPTPVALCQDEGVLGVDFNLMTFVDGRIFREIKMPDSSKEERSAVNVELMRNLTELHKILL